MKMNTLATPRLVLLAALPAALALALTFSAPTAQAAPGAKLLGKWKAVAMEMGGKRHPVKPPMSIIFNYKNGGKFEVSISNGKRNMVQKGTWTATASKLTMTIKGQTETAAYKIAGNKLTMDKSIGGRKAKYHMKKIP